MAAMPVSATPFEPWLGGCPCGELRYALLAEPLFVHACHCTRCQRETGAPFAHHLMIEHGHFEVRRGTPAFTRVPSDSGRAHWVAHCPTCQATLWNEWGITPPALPVTRYVRVGTLDEPARCPPQAHIYVRSKQPWLTLDDGAPQFTACYDAAKAWPVESLARWQAAKALWERTGQPVKESSAPKSPRQKSRVRQTPST
jgi:hypothetical protein